MKFLFYLIYRLINQDFFFYGYKNKEYQAATFLSVLILLNLITLAKVLGFDMFGQNGGLTMIIAFLGVIAAIAIFCNPTHLRRIKERHQDNTKIKRWGMWWLFGYIFLTLFFFILSHELL